MPHFSHCPAATLRTSAASKTPSSHAQPYFHPINNPPQHHTSTAPSDKPPQQPLTQECPPPLPAAACTCGVKEPILARAAEVIALHTAGHSIPRLQLPSLAARDARYGALVGRLAGLDVADAAGVLALLKDVLADGDGDEAGVSAAEAG